MKSMPAFAKATPKCERVVDFVAALDAFLREKAAADNEVRRRPRARTRAKTSSGRRSAALERAAVAVVARIGAGEERGHRIGVRVMQFDAVEARRFRARRRVGEQARQELRQLADMRQIDVGDPLAIAVMSDSYSRARQRRCQRGLAEREQACAHFGLAAAFAPTARDGAA